MNSTELQNTPEQTLRRKEELLTSLRSGVVVLALSVHSVFEGMAIGLEESESGVWKLFLAVSIHAVAIVFCIGTEMMANMVRKAVIVRYILVLSIVTPAGVVIGMVVTSHTDQAASFYSPCKSGIYGDSARGMHIDSSSLSFSENFFKFS